jgi:hypothetical protein
LLAHDVSNESYTLLATVQTSHDDKTIASMVTDDTPSLASLTKWTRRGSPVLRVNATGILAKIGSPTVDNDVVRTLRADSEARNLYLTAVIARVLGMPWDEAGQVARSGRPLPEHIEPFAVEARNPKDSGARWCSVLLLSRTRPEDPRSVDNALTTALKDEMSRENLRAIGCALAGLDPFIA